MNGALENVVESVTLKGRVEEVRDKIVPVLRRYGFLRAVVFGSFVRGR